MMKWLDKINFLPLIAVAAIMAILPVFPEPHLWEKLKMLADGNLVKPVDIFDLVIMHGGASILLFIKILRTIFNKPTS